MTDDDSTLEHPRARGGSARGRHTTVRWVRDMLTASIREGHLPEDVQLIEDLLVTELGASRGAIRNALQALAEEGLLTRRQREGTIVRAKTIRLRLLDTIEVEGDDEDITVRITDQRTMQSTEFLRVHLATDAETVRLVENVFLSRNEVIGVRTAYFSHDVTFQEHFGPTNMIDVAVNLFGTEAGTVLTEISATVADATTSRLLAIKVGAPVLTRTQVFRDLNDAPMEVVFDQYRADRVTFLSEPLTLTRGSTKSS